MLNNSELVNSNLSSGVNFLKDWYGQYIIKASLNDITSAEATNGKAMQLL